MFHFTTFS